LVGDLIAPHLLLDDDSPSDSGVSGECEVRGVPTPPWRVYAERMRAQAGDDARDGDVDPNQFDIEVVAPPRGRLRGLGRFENNLSRKGIFELRPPRAELLGQVDRQDLVGNTTLNFTMGALGVMEMDLVAWTMGQWQRDYPTVTFSLRECARSFGRSWKGELGHQIKESLRRIKGVTITGRVWDAETRRHVTKHFGIFEEVTIIEERQTEHGPATSPATITVSLSPWLRAQLNAGQYSDFEWDGYKRRLQSGFERRLFLLLESQEGEEDGTRYRVRIDQKLGDSLGDQDATRNSSRFRERLRRAGTGICTTHPEYLGIAVKAGERRGEYWLQVERSERWLPNKLARRRARLAGAA
jgi:hypothetical protein